MIFLEILRVAMDAIRANKLRSFLTMLGIVIGVGAVITMVALGEGAQRAVEQQIQSLGTNMLTVRPGQGFFRGVRSGAARLTVEDAEAIAREASTVVEVAPEMDGNYQVEFGRTNANIRVNGTTASFASVNNYRLALGRFFTEAENQGRRRVAVLGSAVSDLLGIDNGALLGRQIQVRNVPFEVIGVFEEKGGYSWFNQDEQIFIPLETARFRVMGSERLDAINLTVVDQASMATAMMEIESTLRREHRLALGKENDFWIQNRAELLGTQQETTRTFGALLASIAAVSLLVGGIGIMNIMLVSVTERTREIGVRKALGATRRAVLLQFLLEATTLCAVGGFLGIVFGFGASSLLSSLANWNTTVSPEAVFLAVLFSVTVGLFFGLWPARRAARLDPIVALRYE